MYNELLDTGMTLIACKLQKKQWESTSKAVEPHKHQVK